MANLHLKESAKLAGLFTLGSWAVNWLMQLIFGSSVKTLFAITSYPGAIPAPVNPVSSTTATAVFSWLGGYIPGFNPGVLLTIFVSSFVAIALGMFLVGSLKLPSASGRVGRITSIILWGTIPLYLLFVGSTIPTLAVAAGVVIYTVVTAWVTAFIADALKISI